LNPAEHWAAFVRTSRLAVLADIDGTLIPFAPMADKTRVGQDLLALLRALGALPGVLLTVVTGRPRESLERLVGSVPGLQLCAEHGGWRRGDGPWEMPVPADAGALESLAAELQRIARMYDAAHVERKTWSVCLHFRGVRPRDRTGLLIEVNAAIASWCQSHAGYERLEASEALEIRRAEIRKSLAVPWVRAQAGDGARLLVLGDDVTDEDMFRALEATDESVLVGPRAPSRTAARWTLPGPDEAAAFLRWIVAVRGGGAKPVHSGAPFGSRRRVALV
jgi:trehalose-phosphatase